MIPDQLTVASAAMAALSCGLTVADPRLQPFLKQAREDQIRLHTQILAANGVLETAAREQAERTVGDRTQFFGQAVLKYYASISGSSFPAPASAYSYSAMSPVTAYPSAESPAQFVPAQPSGSRSAQDLQTFAFQDAKTGHQGFKVLADPSSAAGDQRAHSGVAQVIANVQFNLKKSQVKVESTSDPPKAAPPQTSNFNLLAPLFTPSQPVASHVSSSSSVSSSQAYFKSAQQHWTYRVFSALQTPPAGVDPKVWKQRVAEFVNSHLAQIQTAYAAGQPIPSWLVSLTIPSVSEILGLSPDSFCVHSGSELQAHKDPSSISPLPAQEAPEDVHGDQPVQAKPSKQQHKRKQLDWKAAKKQAKKPADSLEYTMMALGSLSEGLKKLEDRGKRFRNDTETRLGEDQVPTAIPLLTWEEKLALNTSTAVVVGKSQSLEKAYLRLCGPPDPALVRPEPVLKQALKYCLAKWKNERLSHHYIDEQFRSIRQDMTVQRIRNGFTIEVYETNARIALQFHDLGQFNQCQTQLHELHKLPMATDAARIEFLCYRFLYLSLTNLKQESVRFMKEVVASPFISSAPLQFALHFRRALQEENFHRALLMMHKAPLLSKHLINIFVDQLRMTYLVVIAKSHYKASLRFLTQELHFADENQTLQFLRDQQAVWDNDAVDCRKSLRFFEGSTLLQRRKVNAID